MFFHRTPRLLTYIYPTLHWRRPVKQKLIYLTLDDGPIPHLTEFALDVLNDFEAKATFFCVGENLKKNGTIANRILKDGHQMANHTFNHIDGWSTDNSRYFTNVEKCQKQIEALVPDAKKLFRPPYGKIKRSQIKHLSQEYEIIMWDVLSGDYSKKVSPKDCLYNSIKATTKGSIVLFHDNIKAEQNLTYALPKYLGHFKRKGYSFELL